MEEEHQLNCMGTVYAENIFGPMKDEASGNLEQACLQYEELDGYRSL
jgi:hypothetical protein